MGKIKVKIGAPRQPPWTRTTSEDKPPVLPPLSIGPSHLSTASIAPSSTSTSSPETTSTSTSASTSTSTNTTTTTPPTSIPSSSTATIPAAPIEEPPSTSVSATTKANAEHEVKGKGKEGAEEGEEGEGSCEPCTHSVNSRIEWGDGLAPGEKRGRASGGGAWPKRRGFWRRVFGRERDIKGKGVAGM
ncbi:unnamed protein product [Tuber melanosporum]|uniref:(Perigord truffle) hypothetical protein n=1 Tax=Tuber melanosporum (strain Mel28) TaxID=656061 RepID=D5GGV9_TUBMM|nr:uncharacterized protein GSTUM_00002055001 [Tuber melanosporum]CAZ83752.1 unnamed protein product [Tuber melanosporum]